MHAEVEDFLRRVSPTIDWTEKDVVEIGSLNVNGAARSHVPPDWEEWIGIDLLPGDGVDHVGHAVDVLPHLGKFDIAVSTECLEHDPLWRHTVWAIGKALKPKGHLLLTCAGTGRAPHAADGSGGPHPGEYYQNVGLAELEVILEEGKMRVIIGEEGPPGDTRVLAVKI